MKQTVYQFNYYSGDRIKCVRAAEEDVKPEGIFRRNAHLLVVILGILTAYGWWLLWA